MSKLGLDFDLSPDGERIAFRGNRPGGVGVWLMRADGGEPWQLTEGDDLWPAWSPDGHGFWFEDAGTRARLTRIRRLGHPHEAPVMATSANGA